jgi:hypothetical protein
MKLRLHPAALLALAFLAPTAFLPAADPTQGPVDLALTFRSPVSGADQPYRLYLPTAYDGKASVPLFIALHGTTGDHNKYFDHETYGSRIYQHHSAREYSIATASHNLTRNDTMYVSDRRKVPFQHLDLNVLSSAWFYIEKCGGKIESPPPSRLTDAATQ